MDSFGTDAFRKEPTVDANRTQAQPAQIIARRYEIVRRLGSGEMGEVWHAYDVKLRVDVALKSVRRSSPEAVQSLRHEVRIAREVVSPNVCRIFDLIEKDGQEFVSMEYIDGQTLLDFLREKSPLDLSTAYEIASQFLAGLEAIHRTGLVHRDLKPENIMITRTGRAVVMDFGIAERATEIVKFISGTPPYMAPEQLAAAKADVRSDIFAAGVVLAEMISTIRDRSSREIIWNELRTDPPKVSDGPWKTVIARAVANNPDHRFQDVRSLAASLEGAIAKLETTREKNPYPGLSAFKPQDAEYFFGRELELETILKKISQFHLLAMIGPSGAGKTSILHAALIPALPSNWSYAFTQPGDSPFVNLVHAIPTMVDFQDSDDALLLLQQWRKSHAEALLIVDRFEELFTLNDSQTQSRFAELIGRAAVDFDIHILLVMRDDFLISCKEHLSLSPIFSDLTAMLPLTGAALRRALIQPALQCGYRFEDSSLVEEILCDVEKERGALPLMAFAAARLWEKRDRDRRLLTRAAYHQIGGVAGALAQHAENVMEKIGTSREPVVREIFRNLVTSQNTRATRDTDDILSIFQDRNSAEEVLTTLIDSRLLNSFEAAGKDGPIRRVEIIHESLLSAWPRLLRWQTQDADMAQFRDQLYQAAHVWLERGNPIDLLWTGASYKEFEVWRANYSVGLTGAEKAFEEAMVQNARKKRQQRAISIATIFVVLLSILIVIASFWRSEKAARQHAVSQAQHAEASKLLALGRTELNNDPTVALSYAIASLERADTVVARRFALEALWKGPPAFIISDMPIRPYSLNFSPGGKWLGIGGPAGLRLLSSDGKVTIVEQGGKIPHPRWPRFSPNDSHVAWTSGYDTSVIRVWSISEGKEVRSFKLEGGSTCLPVDSHLTIVTNIGPDTALWERTRLRTWSFDDKEPRIIGDQNIKNLFQGIAISNDGHWVVYSRGKNIYTRFYEKFDDSPEEFVGSHDHEANRVVFAPNGKLIASSDSSGEIRIWSLSTKPRQLFRRIVSTKIQNAGGNIEMLFDSSGSNFAASYPNKDRTIALWDLKAPPDTDPLLLSRDVKPYAVTISLHPSNQWIAVPYNDSIAFWPVNHVYPHVLNTDTSTMPDVSGAESIFFTPDGKQLVAGFNMKGIQAWNLSNFQEAGRIVWAEPAEIHRIELDASGKLAVAGSINGRSYLIPLADGKVRETPASESPSGLNSSISPDGRYIASYPNPKFIHIWDSETNKTEAFNASIDTSTVAFSPDGKLFSGDEEGNLHLWDLKTGTSKILLKGNKRLHYITFVRNFPHLVVCHWTDMEKVDLQKARSELKILNVQTGTSFPITNHGDRLTSVAVDPEGIVLVTGDLDGIVRVGPITGEEPHLLYGHQRVFAVAVDPFRRWVASSEQLDTVVRLWKMPTGKPLHALAYDELLKKLRSLTNVRVVADEKSSTGYRIQFERFPGWEILPTW